MPPSCRAARPCAAARPRCAVRPSSPAASAGTAARMACTSVGRSAGAELAPPAPLRCRRGAAAGAALAFAGASGLRGGIGAARALPWRQVDEVRRRPASASSPVLPCWPMPSTRQPFSRSRITSGAKSESDDTITDQVGPLGDDEVDRVDGERDVGRVLAGRQVDDRPDRQALEERQVLQRRLGGAVGAPHVDRAVARRCTAGEGLLDDVGRHVVGVDRAASRAGRISCELPVQGFAAAQRLEFGRRRRAAPRAASSVRAAA